jgi:methylmalonyl-CoA mutase
VEKELAGVPFDKALVHRTAEGLAIQPLYSEGPAGAGVATDAGGERFLVCMRAEPGDIAEHVEGGADAIWVRSESRDDALVKGLLAAGKVAVVVDAPWQESKLPTSTLFEHGKLAARLISTLAYHGAGADAADEIAFALATGVELFKEDPLGFQVAVGRDTFVELAKVRALRICWGKVLVAAGKEGVGRAVIHAATSSRTLTERDPWVNMLRVTAQVFAAVLGGADLVTPASFDQALGAPGDLGRRVARNTGLVLRDESHLGRVRDPAAGSYYLDTLTDALAREAWSRFRTIEREGGMLDALSSGRLRARLEAKWTERLAEIAKRRVPVLGVSEFANLAEKLPHHATPGDKATVVAGALPVHHDSEAFDALRLRADALTNRPEALLVTLGALAESRARVGFATNFFGAGGMRVRETSQADERATVACLCGSDERYAAEAVAKAKALKAIGCDRVLLAGRPGALEPALRDAGVDGFLYVGCDAALLLSELLEAFR